MRAGEATVLSNSGVTSRQLLDGGRVVPFHAGDVVRFEDGDLHGFENTGDGEFEYLSVTSPPVSFRGAYAKEWK